MVGDHEARRTGRHRNLGLVRGHDALDEKRQFGGTDQLGQLGRSLGRHGLALERHGDEPGAVDIHAHGHGTGRLGLGQTLADGRLAAGLDHRDAKTALCGDGGQTRIEHGRIGPVPGHAKGAGGDRAFHDHPDKLGFGEFVAHIVDHAGHGRGQHGQGQAPAEQRRGRVSGFDVVQGPHVQPYPAQGFQIGRKGRTRAAAAHARHLAGTRPAVAHRANPAKSLELFPGLFAKRGQIHRNSSPGAGCAVSGRRHRPANFA